MLLDHRLIGIESDERQIKDNLARVSGDEPAPLDEESKRASLRNQQKAHDRMKTESKNLAMCVEALQNKMDITQELLVARTEMMVIDDNFISLDIRALEERYDASSKIVADHIHYLDNIKKLSVQDLREEKSGLSVKSKPPSNEIFDNGITSLTDELRTLQKQHKIATYRLSTVKHDLGQLEAAILSSPSTKKKNLTNEYGDGNSIDAFCMRRANETRDKYSRRLNERIIALGKKRIETVAELETLKIQEKELRATLIELENKELRIELDLSNQELVARRDQVSSMIEILQTGKVSTTSNAPKAITVASNEEIDMPNLYDVPDYSREKGDSSTRNTNGLSLAELSVGNLEKREKVGESFKSCIEKGRRGSVEATQYMALRQLLTHSSTNVVYMVSSSLT